MSTARSATIPTAPRAQPTANLPVPVTGLIGREREIDEIVTLLQRKDMRLVTLTGPGGVGKTRVAIAVGHRLLAAYPDGICFVDLAPLTDPDFVLPTVAATLGVSITGQQPVVDALIARLRDRICLLVVDNVEQVVDAATSLSAMLRACPRLVMLATSRVPLHVQGEQRYEIAPLTLPRNSEHSDVDAMRRSDAVALFEERARLIKANFHVTHANAGSVAAICQRLDGLPLAIELAAARIRVLPPHGLLERLNARLPLLTDGARDVPARQRRLRGTIAWSYDLLSPAHQRLFRGLSVFRGGWTLEAAGAVAGHDGDESSIGMLSDLDVLVGNSLVMVVEQPDGSMRYTMLETIREFGLERLESMAEAGVVRSRHAAITVRLVHKLRVGFEWPEQAHRLREFDVEKDNVRAALEWLFDTSDTLNALQLVVDMDQYWHRSGHFREAERWTRAALAQHPDADSTLRGWALWWLGGHLWQLGQYEEGRTHIEQSLVLFREARDPLGIARCTYGLALVAEAQGDRDRAIAYAWDALAAYRTAGEIGKVITTLHGLAVTFIMGGEVEQALPLLHEARDLTRQFGNDGDAAETEMMLAWAALETHDSQQAAWHLTAALPYVTTCDDLIAIADAFAACAALATQRQRAIEAARLHGAALRLQADIGATMMPVIEQFQWGLLAPAQREIGDGAWQDGVAAGQQMTFEDAAELAMSVLNEAASPTVPARMSHREIEVLSLLIEGKSNQEIAASLFISPNTVANHVASIMNKLGVDSRTGAATWAVKHGIT